jgi:hypothetical protein
LRGTGQNHFFDEKQKIVFFRVLLVQLKVKKKFVKKKFVKTKFGDSKFF